MDIKETDNKKLTHNLRRPFGISCKWYRNGFDFPQTGIPGIFVYSRRNWVLGRNFRIKPQKLHEPRFCGLAPMKFIFNLPPPLLRGINLMFLSDFDSGLWLLRFPLLWSGPILSHPFSFHLFSCLISSHLNFSCLKFQFEERGCVKFVFIEKNTDTKFMIYFSALYWGLVQRHCSVWRRKRTFPESSSVSVWWSFTNILLLCLTGLWFVYLKMSKTGGIDIQLKFSLWALVSDQPLMC